MSLANHMSGDGIVFRLLDLSELTGGPFRTLTEVRTRYERLRLANHAVSGQKLHSAARNCATPDDAYDAALRCEAMEMLPARRSFNKFGEHIQLTHVRGASLSMHIGSCRSSVVQPWVGFGLFEQREGAFIPRIFGQTGMAHCEFKLVPLESVRLPLSKRTADAISSFAQLKSVPILVSAGRA